MEAMKYFLLNKEEDFVKQREYLCSDLMDSREKQTQWSRMKIEQLRNTGKVIRIWLFTSEQDSLIWKNRKYSIRQLILEENIQMEEKMRMFSSCEVKCLEAVPDCLLDHITGRYMWLVAKGAPGQAVLTDGIEIQIFFQAESWLTYLPDVYGRKENEDSFLFRYLSIFQWIYYDMSQKISSIPHKLYPAYADADFLEWMAGWFAIENVSIWNREQLVYLMENGKRLSGIRGTRQYMEELVFLYTGYKPFIVEYYQADRYKTDIKKAKLLERLYGENVYIITIILPKEAVPGQQEIAILHQIIDLSAPACTECRLVALESYIFLDRYTYLGINSCLNGYRNVKADDSGLIPYISVIGDKL